MQYQNKISRNSNETNDIHVFGIDWRKLFDSNIRTIPIKNFDCVKNVSIENVVLLVCNKLFLHESHQMLDIRNERECR